jgi:STE24 endopeptidase
VVAAVGLAAVAVAEIVAWLIGPHGGVIDADRVPATAYFSAAQLDRAADFSGPQRLIGLGALLVQLAVLALLALWRPGVLRSALATACRRPLIGAAAVAAAISLALTIAGLPLAAIGHERARDFGLATQGLGPWLSDQARSAAIGAGLAAIGGFAAIVLIRRLGRRFWVGGTLLVVAYAVIATWLAPVLLAPVFNDFQQLPQGPTRARVMRLGHEAGVEIGRVYRVDASRRSTALNAYVDGLGSSKRVVIYDNAIRELSPAELDSIVAHELGHVEREDILHGIGFVALIAPLGVLFVQLLSWSLAGRTGDDVRTPGVIPALALSVTLATLVLGVPGNQLSRRVEARADTFALELTRDPAAFIAMQKRLVLNNVSDPDPPGLTHFLFGSHPSAMERIGAAAAFRREATPRRDTRGGS